MIPNKFINIDTKLWENANIKNFDIKRSEEMMYKLSELMTLDVIPTNNNYSIRFTSTDVNATKMLIKLISKALENIELCKKNQFDSTVAFRKSQRDNRKWYQFWKIKSDEKIENSVHSDFYSWSGTLNDLTYFRSVLVKDLEDFQSILLTSIQCYDTNGPTFYKVEYVMRRRRFAQFLHYLTDESALYTK